MKTRSTLKFGQPIKPAEPVSTPVVAQPGEQVATKPAPAAPLVDQQKPPSPKK